METEATGDLNGDGRPDLAFILLAPDFRGAPPRSSPYDSAGSYANPRMFGIAFGQAGGGYRLALGNHRFLPPKWAPNGASQGWMLFGKGSLELRGGSLRVLFEYTRGNRIFTFRWRDGRLRLIGFDNAGVDGGCFHGLSVNFLSGRAKSSAGRIDRERDLVRWTRLKSRALLTVEQIGNGEDFDPDGLIARHPLTCGIER